MTSSTLTLPGVPLRSVAYLSNSTCIACPHRLVTTPAASRRLAVVADGSESQGRDRGWFFNNFVKDHHYENRRVKMVEECTAREGKVDTLFDNAFKYTAWLEVHRVLTQVGQKSIPCEEALGMVKRGRAVLLDVRESQDFDSIHAEPAANAPLFRLIQGSDLKANLRRLGYALMTDFAGTERNPDFVAAALRAVGGDQSKTVVVMCNRGGCLDSSVTSRSGYKFTPPERMFGNQSRSLKACYELRQAGFTNVLHLSGGLNQWLHEGLPDNEVA